jgi:hypothetical protein
VITAGCAKSVSCDGATAARNDGNSMRLAPSAGGGSVACQAWTAGRQRARLPGSAVGPAAMPGRCCPSAGHWGSRPDRGGELIMADHKRLIPAPAEPTVARSCWMCGIRLPAGQMVADGGSACADVRWYCLDTRGCTDRWTRRLARSAGVGQGSARTPKTRGGQLAAWSAGTGRLRRCVLSPQAAGERHRGGKDPALAGSKPAGRDGRAGGNSADVTDREPELCARTADLARQERERKRAVSAR